MSDKCSSPTIVAAVCSTVTGLLALAGCLCMMKSGGADFLVFISILANVGLIALAVLQWVIYFRAYVDYRIDQLRREQQSRVSVQLSASMPAN